MIDSYIALARKKFAEFADVDRRQEFGRSLQQLDLLYTRSLRIQDYKACLSILKERADLLGLHAPTKKEHSGPGGGPIPVAASTLNPKDLTDTELEAIRAIHARQAAAKNAGAAGPPTTPKA